MILLGHPALRLLLRLKLRGHLRRQKRRLRTPRGLVYMVVGLIVTLGWAAALLFSPGRREPLDRGMVQLLGGVFALVTAAGALAHRGLHIPRQELEPLLSSPVSRRDLVRYRLLSTIGPSLLGGLILGAVAARNLPVPWLGFAGVFVAMLTLPLLGQGVSLLAGSAELRLGAPGLRPALKVVQVGGLLLLAAGAMLLVLDPDESSTRWARRLPGAGELLRHPWLAVATAPLRPWAGMMTAPDLARFLPWLGLCLAIWLLAFEAIARLPVDFRELSLATSADLARRLRRMQRGAGASAGEASRRAAGWRVPWLLGRGPFGAVAWRKSCSILRKARGMAITSGLILTLLVLLSTAFSPGGRAPAGVGGSAMVAFLGTIYLCGGLRFDFREELDAMESLKTWPLAPWRLFLGTILPEVVLVVVLLAAAVGARAAITGESHPLVLGVVAALPFFVLLWVAIDNAAFLYAPVRFVPGQEGALHHAGRAMTMMLVRMAAFLALVLPVALAVGVVLAVRGDGEEAKRLAVLVAAGAAALIVLAEIVLLVWIGGRLFRRFDVARDRG